MQPDDLFPDRLADLVARSRSGDMSAFGTLVLHYQLPLRLYAARLGLRGEMADEITQEAFVRALESLHRFDPDRSFAAWLKGITFHVYQKELERRRREEQARTGALAAFLASHGAPASPEAGPVQSRLAALRDCVRNLSAKSRSLLSLRFTEGLPMEAIARRIGSSSVGAVSKALFRIRANLARCVRLALEGTEG